MVKSYLSAFCLSSKTTRVHLFSLLLLIIAPYILISATRHEKRIIRYKFWEEASKNVIPGDMVVDVGKVRRMYTLLELRN